MSAPSLLVTVSGDRVSVISNRIVAVAGMTHWTVDLQPYRFQKKCTTSLQSTIVSLSLPVKNEK